MLLTSRLRAIHWQTWIQRYGPQVFAFLLGLFLIDASSRIAIVNQGDFMRAVGGFVDLHSIDQPQYSRATPQAFLFAYLAKTNFTPADWNSTVLYFWLTSLFQRIYSLHFDMSVTALLSRCIVLLCCWSAASNLAGWYGLKAIGKTAAFVLFACVFFTAHIAEFFNSFYGEHVFIVGLALLFAGCAERRLTRGNILLIAGIVLIGLAKTQYFYFPALFLGVLLLFRWLAGKGMAAALDAGEHSPLDPRPGPDFDCEYSRAHKPPRGLAEPGKRVGRVRRSWASLLCAFDQERVPVAKTLVIACIVVQIGAVALAAATPVVDYNRYHSLYFGSYKVMTAAERRGLGLTQSDIDCIGVDAWNWKMVTGRSVPLISVPGHCFELHRPNPLSAVLRPYLRYPSLLLRVVAWAARDHFTVHYFEVGLDNPYIRPSNGNGYRNGHILLRASDLREKFLTPIWFLLAIAGIVVPFLAKSAPATLRTLILMLALFIPSQILVSVLGEGVRDLSKHLMAAQLSLDLLTSVLVFQGVLYLWRRLAHPRASRDPLPSSQGLPNREAAVGSQQTGLSPRSGV